MRTIIGLAVAVALAAPVAAQEEQAKRLHAGIEVGGRGVKCTVLEVGADGLYRRLMARTSNTTLSVVDDQGRFRAEAIDEAVKAIADFHRTCRDTFKVPDANIHVVGS